MVSITSAPSTARDRREDALPVLAAGRVDDDVAQAVAAVDLHQVDGPDDAAGLADRAR